MYGVFTIDFVFNVHEGFVYSNILSSHHNFAHISPPSLRAWQNPANVKGMEQPSLQRS